eukprot:gene7815-12288_t
MSLEENIVEWKKVFEKHELEEIENFLNDNSLWKALKGDEENNKFGTKLNEETVKIKTDVVEEEYEIFYRHYEQKDPVGVLFMFHGLGNCSGMRNNLAELFVRENYEVFAFDQYGHGKSVGNRLSQFDNFEILYKTGLQFVQKMYQKNSKKFEKLPLFFIGESMGGATILECLLNLPQDFPKVTGVILSAAAIELKAKPNVVFSTIFSAFSYTFPSFTLGRGDPARNTRFITEQERRTNHPEATITGLPSCTAREMIRMSDHLLENLSEIDIPILIHQGTNDYVVDPNGSKLLYQNCKSKDKKLIIYHDGLHSLLTDHPAMDALQESLNWVKERSK